MARLPLVLLLLLFVALALPPAARGDLLDADAKISMVTADGREQELTAAEFEAMARAQHEAQSALQREPTEEWLRDRSLEDVAREDPELARLVSAARRAFATLQRLGHAPEALALAGFSEKEVEEAQQPPPAGLKGELRVLLELQAAPKGGRGTGKLAFDVDVLLDAELRVWLLSAWVLDGPGGRRVRQLRVDAQDAPEKQQHADRVKLLLLVGGVVLMAGGLLVLYGSRPPAWAEAKQRAEAAAKARDEARKHARKTTLNRAAQQWTLDDKKAQ